MSKNIKEDKIIKETKYCKIINQGKVGDDEEIILDSSDLVDTEFRICEWFSWHQPTIYSIIKWQQELWRYIQCLMFIMKKMMSDVVTRW